MAVDLDALRDTIDFIRAEGLDMAANRIELARAEILCLRVELASSREREANHGAQDPNLVTIEIRIPEGWGPPTRDDLMATVNHVGLLIAGSALKEATSGG